MKQIALTMELSDYYDHGIARGIIRYTKTRPDWKLYGHGWMFSPLADLREWQGDGVIARIEYRETSELLQRLTCPVVDVANTFRAPGIHLVCNDDVETGRIAGRHFRRNGFTSLAYCGVSDGEWSRNRFRGFVQALGAQREIIPVFERPLSWWLQEPHGMELALFLSRLPKPAALFACNDKTGLRASSVCASEGISVPEQVAIIGVDNEDIPCELADPSLSSIELQLEQIGFLAAKTLDALMDGNTGLPGEQAVAPVGLIDRRSTSAYAGSDPIIVEAYRSIRAEKGCMKSVAQIAREVAVSRRTLETHFRRQTGRTVHQAILTQKINIAIHLLRTTNLKVEAVAGEAGFGSMQRFFAHFKQHTGTTPNRFRRRDHDIRSV